jgi:hypothetical protein
MPERDDHEGKPGDDSRADHTDRHGQPHEQDE